MMRHEGCLPRRFCALHGALVRSGGSYGGLGHRLSFVSCMEESGLEITDQARSGTIDESMVSDHEGRQWFITGEINMIF